MTGNDPEFGVAIDQPIIARQIFELPVIGQPIIDIPIMHLPMIDIALPPIVNPLPWIPPVNDGGYGSIGSDAAEIPWGGFQSNAEFDRWLTQTAVEQWGNLFGESTYGPYFGSYWQRNLAIDQPMLFSEDLALSGAGVGADIDNFSTTNVQVEGVDEADLFETDGQYLYIISGKDLVIVDAGEGEDLRVVSRVHLTDRPVGMYLSGDRLAIVSSRGQTDWQNSYGGAVVMLAVDSSSAQFDAGPSKTTVTVLDIADRAAPTLVQKTEMDGQLITSRVVDGQLRLVLGHRMMNLPMPIAHLVDSKVPPVGSGDVNQLRVGGWGNDVLNTDAWYPPQGAQTSVYETQDEYLARVRDEVLDSLCPQARSLSIDDNVLSETSLLDAAELRRSGPTSNRFATTIATFDLARNVAGPVAIASVTSSSANKVYATADSIYLFAAQQGVWQPSGLGSWQGTWVNDTAVWKFDIDAETDAVAMVAKGKFSGSLLNQFAADEYDGYLRVVTTGGGDSSGQNLFVLEQVGNRLEVVGHIGGIAGGERLHSVRFMGDRAFLVTFRQVDPLFALDLSDPTDPKPMGELVIPGVSGYLQPLDENHLLGVGRAMGSSGQMFSNLEVSIFDVSDLNHPRLVNKYDFDGGWSTTTPILNSWWIPFTGDHHAASYFPEEHIFTMPVFSTSGGNLDGVESTPIFEPGEGGLQVFRIDVDAGFTPLTFIEHDTQIERSVKIGDRLFAISSGTVTVHELANPANQLGKLEIGGELSSELTELEMYLPIMSTLMETTNNLLPATSDTTTRVVDPRAGWALPDLARSRQAQPARVIAFANLAGAPRLDTELVQLLAIESAGRDILAKAVPGVSPYASGTFEDDTISAMQHQGGLTEDIVTCVAEPL